jgi:hypothetical protein
MPNEFVTRNGFISKNNSVITGSLTATLGITGSVLSASYSNTASYTISSLTASYVVSAISASYSTFAATTSFATSASAALKVSYDTSARITDSIGYLYPNWCMTAVSGTFSSVPGQDNILLTPLLIRENCYLSSSIVTFASTSSNNNANVRIGVYSDNGSTLPNTLLCDFGIVGTTSASFQNKELLVPGAAGTTIPLKAKTVYWISVVCEAGVRLPVPYWVNGLYNPILQVELSASAAVAGLFPFIKNIGSYGIVSASSVTNGMPSALPQTITSYTVNSYQTSSLYIGPLIKVIYT